MLKISFNGYRGDRRKEKRRLRSTILRGVGRRSGCRGNSADREGEREEGS
jgi:hypothetical protein